MKDFTEDQYKLIFKTGQARYDIDLVKSTVLYSLYDKLRALDQSDIIPFLEYQISDNLYPDLFRLYFDGSTLQKAKVENEKGAVINKWIFSEVNLQSRHKKKADTIFSNLSQRRDIQEWEGVAAEFIRDKSPADVLHLFQYGKCLLSQRLKLHNVECDIPYDCFVEDSLEDKIEITDIMISKASKSISSTIGRMEWNGTQKQLAELFINLKNKGWIESFDYNTIKACFTKSNTIDQVLKPSTDTSTGQDNYEGVYTSQYDPRFHGIRRNPKADK